MTKHRAPPRRVDVEHFINTVANATEAERNARNELDYAKYESEYQAFSAAYEREECYLCGLPFKIIRSDRPCVHWLLRRGKFKKNDIPKIYETFPIQ
ncbi:MAG: hypothetical protein Q7K26_05105 [bacterium]|nr:hypothetical protein [bacterium]